MPKASNRCQAMNSFVAFRVVRLAAKRGELVSLARISEIIIVGSGGVHLRLRYHDMCPRRAIRVSFKVMMSPHTVPIKQATARQASIHVVAFRRLGEMRPSSEEPQNVRCYCYRTTRRNVCFAGVIKQLRTHELLCIHFTYFSLREFFH